ncbi:hypothetical protein EV1_002890 [Malus domestica]
MSLTTRFMIVDCPSSYIVILRRSFPIEMNVTINWKMLVVKFLTTAGVGMVRGDKVSAMVCYAIAVKVKTKVTTQWLVRTLGGSPASDTNSC